VTADRVAGHNLAQTLRQVNGSVRRTFDGTSVRYSAGMI